MPSNKPATPPFSVSLPVPYGARILDDGVLFTIYSRHATRVWLMLFDDADAAHPSLEIELDPRQNRIGDLWQIHVPGIGPGHCYLYRMDGRPPEGMPNTFDPGQWLLDPAAKAISRPGKFGSAEGLSLGEALRSGSHFPKGVVVADDFDWGDDRRPNIPLADTIFYELHTRGYTQHPSSRVKARGTYRGLIEKLPYIRSLGVNAVELLPIHEFNEMEYFIEGSKRQDLRNFWGYSSLGFFAANSRYAADRSPQGSVREFKELVKACHAAGLEVILDVVYNHTGEGGLKGATYNFRGIDNSIYYMMEPDGSAYRNYTGCGNTVNCNHPAVQDFIIQSLRYWALEMRVDGFRFDLASIFTRGLQGEVLTSYSLVDRIAEDPILRDRKLIAEAWDAAGLYQVGSFPHRAWSEWNGRFRDDVRRFWKGDQGFLRPFAERFMASPDLYRGEGRAPQKSVNLVTCHDGFTLNDLVSYNHKHNEANCEDNRDGENHNHSYNFGNEGPATNPHIQMVRHRQQKNFIATMMLAQGVPLLLAGDELSQTQNGNNNSYCQDSELTWIDWTGESAHRDLLEFTRKAIALRAKLPLVRQSTFLQEPNGHEDAWTARWMNGAGEECDWGHARDAGCLIRGAPGSKEAPLFIIFNADENAHDYQLPDHGASWTLILSTQEKTPRASGGHVRVEGLSLNAFRAKPAP